MTNIDINLGFLDLQMAVSFKKKFKNINYYKNLLKLFFKYSLSNNDKAITVITRMLSKSECINLKNFYNNLI